MTQQSAARGDAALLSDVKRRPTHASSPRSPARTSMNALLELIERETALVRAGKITEAMPLEAQKTELSRRYVAGGRGRCSRPRSHVYMKRATPDLLTALTRHHDTFRAMLQVNLTVLATAHAVSEGIIRGVNAEVQRRNMPNTYTAAGQRAAPGPRHVTPLAVSQVAVNCALVHHRGLTRGTTPYREFELKIPRAPSAGTRSSRVSQRAC